MEKLILTLCFLLLAVPVSAQVVWEGNLETGDLSQFNFLLNPTINNVDYTTVVQDTVAEGMYGARIELHDDAVWPNGLRRVELQHAPAAARTADGATTFFAWSFYVPETLSENPSQQIGYWESDQSYQQMMAFTLVGDDLRFVTRQPQNIVHWDGVDVVTPATWHRIAMRVLWSKDPNVGQVDIWFDGEQVVTNGSAKTLNDDNPHFVQFGLLRGDVDFADVPTIYIDDAVEGLTLDDVRPDALTTPTTMDDPDMGAGSDPDVGNGDPDLAASQDTGDSTPNPEADGGTDDGGSANADGKGGCATSDATPSPWLIAWVIVIALRRSSARQERSHRKGFRFRR